MMVTPDALKAAGSPGRSSASSRTRRATLTHLAHAGPSQESSRYTAHVGQLPHPSNA